jgi:hypothetical protein
MAPERAGSFAGLPVGLTLGGCPRGRLADPLDGFVCAEAELVSPALDEDPLAVTRVKVTRAG